jgi:superfamily II DNA or RNA helicase
MTTVQGSLFDEQQVTPSNLPVEARMPLNIAGRKVRNVLFKDLCEAGDALVVTGYSGLDQLIQLINQRGEDKGVLRLLLGSEPSPSRQPTYSLKQQNFDAEVRAYWLKRGISVRLSGQLIRCAELIRGGYVQVRYPGGRHRVHAKMYCTVGAVSLGSSNFTEPGLNYQDEANVRFPASEKARFRETWQVAEHFWNGGIDANAQLLALLEQLLKFVNWDEALARACAELLEGEWAASYLRTLDAYQGVSLWPSQKKGIGQALYLLETVGGVLVADATGSGKTRMGAHLLRAVHDRNWSSARSHKGSMLLVCPPLVAPSWERERANCGFSMEVASHGLLSHLDKKQTETALAVQLANAQTLAVDEAHNFLNTTSNRTQRLLHNLSDQTLLFTATPINRSAVDLLRLIDILGADNFDDEVLTIFERLNRSGHDFNQIHPDDLAQLQSAIARFTLRRTKAQLNAMVDREPEAYRAANGRVCRYPKHQSQSYWLHESEEDQRIAGQIRVLAQNLKGLGHFEKPLIMPESWQRQSMTAESYLQMRLLSASALAAHHVMGSLRSSKLAVLRHILGEQKALLVLGLQGELDSAADDKGSGNMRERLEQLKGKVPGNQLGIDLPIWLSDPQAHITACEREIGTYDMILKKLNRLTDGRERRKADFLLELASRHEQVIAFDHFPLTLRYLKHLLHKRAASQGLELLLGVGGNKQANEKLQERLNPATGSGHIIALCSDAMSEGVNLQRASTMVHLDMPSVVRYAEQRVGRIDRMDSPHDQIECWWPKDAEAFALKADERFVARVETVDSLIGGNLQLPEEMQASSGRVPKVITAEELEQEIRERELRSWDGIEDAFSPVRGLLEGPQALVSEDVYQDFQHEVARVLARVSLVRTEQPWMFICLAGGEHMAPRWVMLPALDAAPLSNLRDIVTALRTRLGPQVENLPITRSAGKLLESFLGQLSLVEQMLLPRLKQRALEQMHVMLKRWSQQEGWLQTSEQAEQIKRLIDLRATPAADDCPDWGQLADCWLDLVRPTWAEHLKARGRKTGVTRLRDIQKDLLAKPIAASKILDEITGIDTRRNWDERIVACILGVGAEC